MIKKETNKNGLIELFRFFCSVWVAYFHGFSPILSDKFNGVNISVDFFFMVSGFFFLKSIEKYRERPYAEGVRFIFWGRTKRFIVPLIIAALSVLYCNIAFELEFNGFNWPFSFLWFFAAQFVFLSLFYLLLKKTKNITSFNIACVIIICIFMSLFRLLFKVGAKQIDIPARGPAMLALGMLISQIPKINIKLKDNAKSEKINLIVNAVGFAISAIAFVYLAYLPGFATWKLHLFTCVVCPSLVYFASALPVRSRFLNLLGELSVFIYLAQCPILIHHYYVSRDTRDQFPLFCVCIIAMFVINRVINKAINKKKVIK
jgi:peptidoglycan/LPS O-acetylase OafA/YrhL